MNVKAISPEEVKQIPVVEKIPDYVFQIFNDLISMRYDGKNEIIIFQDEVIDLILQHEDHSIQRQDIFENKWLDVENPYRDVGWKVQYEKPIAWGGENFKSHFIFSTK